MHLCSVAAAPALEVVVAATLGLTNGTSLPFVIIIPISYSKFEMFWISEPVHLWSAVAHYVTITPKIVQRPSIENGNGNKTSQIWIKGFDVVLRWLFQTY